MDIEQMDTADKGQKGASEVVTITSKYPLVCPACGVVVIDVHHCSLRVWADARAAAKAIEDQHHP